MKLTITDGDTSWEVEALDERDPDFPQEYMTQMLMYGHVYVFRNTTTRNRDER